MTSVTDSVNLTSDFARRLMLPLHAPMSGLHEVILKLCQEAKENGPNSFLSFVEGCSKILVSPIAAKLTSYDIEFVIKKTLKDYEAIGRHDERVTDKVLQCLQPAYRRFRCVKPSMYLKLLEESANLEKGSPAESHAKQFFEELFSEKGFANEFIRRDGASAVLGMVLKQSDSERGEWMIDLIQDKLKHRHFEAEAPLSFFDRFGAIEMSQIQDNAKAEKLLRLFSWLFLHSKYQKRKISARAEKSKAFLKYCMLAYKVSSETFTRFVPPILCTEDEIMVPPTTPNLYFVMALREFCEIEKSDDAVLQVFTPLKIHMQDKKRVPERINEVFPVVLWYSKFMLPINEQISFLEIVREYVPYECRRCLEHLMKRMKESQPLDDVKLYNNFLGIIYKLLDIGEITRDELNRLGFCTIFLEMPPVSVLAEIWCDPQNRLNLACDLYNRVTDTECVDAVFHRILEMCSFCPPTASFFRVAVEFFLHRCSKEKMDHLLKWIKRSGQVSCGCDLLKSSFLTEVKIAQHFVKCNGIEWMDDALKDNLMTIELYADLISHLVILRRFDEVDQYISTLPQEHPLFSLSRCELDSVAYGRNRDKYRPIRICSLLKYVGLPEDIDPYNAWILGNFAVSQYLASGASIFDVPMIKDIGNRFLLPEHADMLMQRPYELGRYCDPNYDHFPLFQFFQGQESMEIREEFKSISFWMKFSMPIRSIVTIFHTTGVEIKVTADSIRLFIDGNQELVSANPTQWNFVCVTENDAWLRSTVQIVINEKVIEKRRQGRGKFQVAAFESIAPCLLFFGPSIRFSQSNLDYRRIYRHRPSCMYRLHQDETIVLPYAFASPFNTSPMSSKAKKKIQLKVPRNCVGVPYFGIPFHFMSNRRMYYLFRILLESPSAEEFSSLFDALLNINSVTVKNSERFWAKMLNACKCKPDYLSDKLLADAFSRVCALDTDVKGKKDVFSFMTDPQLWNSVDNRTLVRYVLESQQWDPSRRKERGPNLELFLVKVVLRNPQDSDLILDILNNPRRQLVEFYNCLAIILMAKDPKALGISEHETTTLRLSILRAFIQFVKQCENPTTIRERTQEMHFQYLFLLLSDSIPEVQVLACILIFEIEGRLGDYMVLSTEFLLSVAKLSKHREVWDAVRFYAIRSNIWDISLPIQGEYALPVILALVCSVTVCIIHAYSFCRGDLTGIDPAHDMYDSAIWFCREHTTQILECSWCKGIMTQWFPAVLTSSDFVQTKVDHDRGTSKRNNNIRLFLQNEDMLMAWIGQVLDEYGYEVPVNKTFGANMLREWMDKSTFCLFLCNLMKESGKEYSRLAPVVMMCPILQNNNLNGRYWSKIPLLFSPHGPSPIDQALPQWIQVCTPAIVHNFFVSSGGVLDESVARSFMKYLHFLVRIRCFENNSLRFIKDVLFFWTKQSTVVELFAGDILAMVLHHLDPTSKSMDRPLLEELKANSERIKTLLEFDPSMRDCFAYVLGTKNDGMELAQSLGISLDNSETLQAVFEKKGMLYHAPFMSAVQDLDKVREEYKAQEKRMFGEIRRIRDEEERLERNNISKAEKLNQRLRTLNSSSIHAQQMALWKLEMQNMQEKATELRNFQPKCLKTAGRCFPFYPEVILRPSQFTVDAEAQEVFRSCYAEVMNLDASQSRDKTDREAFEAIFGEASMVKSCILMRVSFELPGVLFLYDDRFRFLANAEYDDSQRSIKLLPLTSESFPSFVESVLANEFMSTELFHGHIVIVYKSMYHLSARVYRDGVEFWSLSHGHFVLKVLQPTDQCLFELLKWNQRIDYPYTTLLEIKNEKDAINEWRLGRLSNIELLLWLNADRCKSFADCRSLPVFPERKIDYICFKDRSEAGTQDARLYFLRDFYIKYKNPLNQVMKNCAYLNQPGVVPEFLKSVFQIPISSREIHKPKAIFGIDVMHVCQELVAKLKEKQTLGFNGNQLYHVGKLSTKLNTSPPILVKVSKKRQSIIFREKSTKGLTLFTEFDHLFVFASSIAVSHNAMFVTVDFVFGLTRVYLIHYEQRKPRMLTLLTEFNWFAKPRSAVSGTHWVVATARRRFLVLWSAITGHIYHKIEMDSPIQSIALDENFGVWVVTELSILFVAINGGIVARRALNGVVITAIAAGQANGHVLGRGAICGTDDGKLFVLCPCVETELIDAKQLPSQHKAGVRAIVINDTSTAFLTIDRNQKTYLWTGALCRLPRNLDFKYFAATCCPLCGRTGQSVFCSCCSRLVCSSCVDSDGKCGVCNAIQKNL